MNILNFQNVNFVREKHKILKDINWQIDKKENWAILGLNGSGKTTLLQLICGYLWPSSGTLDVLGQRFGKTSIPELRKKIGWVSAGLQYQLKDYDTAERIALSGKFASIGIYEKFTTADLEKAKDILSFCGGKELIGKPFAILSQGQRQIVLIARAMMANPQLLILDEPCNGLDIFARERLLQQVQEIVENPQAPTVLLVTHHTEEIIPCFDNLLLLREGEITHQGKTADLLNEATLSHFYPEPVELVKMHQERIVVYPK